MWYCVDWRWSRNRLRRRRRWRKQALQGAGPDMAFGRGSGKFRAEQAFYAANQFLRLKGFADQFIGFHGDGLVGDGFVDDPGHQDDGNGAEFGMLLDLRADGVAVLIGHDDIGDDDIRRILFELRERRGGIGAGDDVEALATESNLDDFAHGGAVVDEIDRGRAFRRRIGHRWDGHCFAHSASLSAMSRVLSSNSRMASSMRSVALRSTVCCVEVL